MLTPLQQADARRYMGYPMIGDTSPDDRSDVAYAQVTSGRFQTLAHRLTSLRAEEEAIVANFLVMLPHRWMTFCRKTAALSRPVLCAISAYQPAKRLKLLLSQSRLL